MEDLREHMKRGTNPLTTVILRSLITRKTPRQHMYQP